MAKTRVHVEFGMGTSLRRQDYTKAKVRAVKGGLDVADTEAGTRHVVATAAIEAFLPDLSGQYKLS